METDCLIYLWRSLSLSTSRSLSCWAWASFRWYWACSSECSCSADRVTAARRSIRSSHSCRACVSLWAADSSSSFTRALDMHRTACLRSTDTHRLLEVHNPYTEILHIYTTAWMWVCVWSNYLCVLSISSISCLCCCWTVSSNIWPWSRSRCRVFTWTTTHRRLRLHRYFLKIQQAYSCHVSPRPVPPAGWCEPAGLEGRKVAALSLRVSLGPLHPWHPLDSATETASSLGEKSRPNGVINVI